MSPTSAATIGARTLLPVVPAAVAAPPRLGRRVRSAPTFFGRPRVASDGQAGTTRRLPERRRAAAWGRRGCISTVPTPALRSRVLFPEHGPAASSLPQGNCRPVDPRGSRPAFFREAA